MKQHISVEQLSELTSSGKQKLRSWWKPQYGDQYFYENILKDKGLVIDFSGNWITTEKSDQDGSYDIYDFNFCLPLLSLGQLIQFLYDHNINMTLSNCDTKQVTTSPSGHWQALFLGTGASSSQRNELIELLWPECITILNAE